MPSAAATPSSLYPLAILDCGASTLRLTLQPTPPTTSLPPIHITPNAIARTRPPSKKIFVGSDIESSCTDFSGLTLRLPVERGFTTDWLAAKTVWDAEIGRAMAKLPASKQIATSSSGKLLDGWNLVITETYFNLPELETGLETLWFEEYGVRGIWRTTTAQLASFAPLQLHPPKMVTVSAEGNAANADEESNVTQDSASAHGESSSPTKSSELSSPHQSAPTITSSRRQKRQSGLVQTYSETSSKAKADTVGARLGFRRRPEACVMIDLGHSYTHVVPIVQGEVAWSGVRRLDIGGKLMTNVLKEMISFQQWDMMEESWIISHLKEKAFFVAASELEAERHGPSSWKRAKLLQLAKKRKGQNPIEQEFLLPDYFDAKVSKNPELRYGRIRKGPGKTEPVSNTKGKADGGKGPLLQIEEESDGIQEEREADAFIADEDLLRAMELSAGQSESGRGQGEDVHDEEENDDEDEGEDYRDSGSESGRDSPIKGSFQAHQQQQRSTQAIKRKASGALDGEDEQVLVLSNERWQIPELLFNPQQIGLDALPLPDLILSSITATSCDDALRGLMFANIVLVGGLASIPNLRRRVELDLRSLAPDDVAVRVRVSRSPAMAGVHGGLHLPKGFLTGKLIGREEWEKPGQGTALSRERFLGWSSQAAQHFCKMLV